jgi:DNA excision repair protein ERCC-4
MEEVGLMPESFDTTYGLLAPDDAVIIRPYGGEDDDILLQELRPRFVIMYEPNLAFIRRLEVRMLTLRGRYILLIYRYTRIVTLVWL